MTAHRPAQIVRLSAIVVSGAASLCLTVAAGAYIVNHMPELAPPAQEYSGPATAPNPGHHRPLPIENSAPRGGVELAMSFGAPALSTERSEPAATRTPITTLQSSAGARPGNSPLTGRIGIGDTYVGAQVAPARSDAVAFTVDTNLATVAVKYLGLTPDPTAVTVLRTEFDSGHGELVLALSDPALGSHTLRVDALADTEPTETAPAADQVEAEAPRSPTEELPTTVGV